VAQLIGDWIILGLLVAEVVFLSRLDRRRFGTWVTPFTVLGYPYAAVVILAYFLAPVFDFVPLYTGSVVVWIVGLFLVWAAGAFLGWGLLDLRLAPNLHAPCFRTEPVQEDDDATLRVAVALSWAAMPFMSYGVVVSARDAGGWTEIGSTGFSDAYGHGLHAHAVVLAMLLGIVLIGLYRKGDKHRVATIAMILVFLMLGRVKGTILQVIIGGVFLRMIRGQFHLSFKKVAILLGTTYVVFNVVYMISMKVFQSDDPLNGDIYTFLGRHYLYYLFAGVLAFSEAMRSGIAGVGGDWHTIFSPFLNIYHVVFGGSLVAAGSPHEKGMDTDLLMNVSSETNVYTMFGTLHMDLGALGAGLYVFVVGLLCYGFLILVRRRNNTWVTASYCLIAGQLTFGFFEFYFWHLTGYEVIVFGALLAFATKAKWRPLARGHPVAG
jgi:oligosaccharide repeat unit polymerase